MRRPIRIAPFRVCAAFILLAAGAAVAQQRTGTAVLPRPPGGAPTSLNEALGRAYLTNPTLAAGRAQLRATDENVPTALAGWRPNIQFTGGAGYARNTIRDVVPASKTFNTPAVTAHTGGNAPTGSTQTQVTQQIYNGGATRIGTNRAESQVRAQRAQLILTEQQLFTNTINAYVNVFAATQALVLNIENEQAYARELVATRVRFKVGDVTLTDIAQSEAALAGSTSARQTTERDLATARAQFAQYVGDVPGTLLPPQPLRAPALTIDMARGLAATNNPSVVAALFNVAVAKDTLDLQFAALMPNANVQSTTGYGVNQGLPNTSQTSGQYVGNLNVPVYSGGSEYAAIRAARQSEQQAAQQLIDARRAAMEQAANAWVKYASARANTESTRAQIRANEVAYEGVRRELIVGSRSTLDLLNAQQAVLNSKLTLVQNVADTVTASYGVAAAVGKLTARDLALGRAAV